MSRILLTDAQQRKTLAAARSLGSKGIDVLTAEVTRWATARFSRYCRRGLVYPGPGSRPHDFYNWLTETLIAYPCDVMFPMDDSSLEVVIKNREQLEKLCRIPLPATNSYLTAFDKALATEAAREAGLDCPKTVTVSDLGNIMQTTSGLNFPVLVKPRKSSGSRGMVVVHRKSDLVEQYLKVHQDYPFPMIQEYINQGEKFDVCLLFDHSSRLKAFFVQKELRYFPLEMGPSTVQESVWRPDLVEKAEYLLRKLNWYGVAEVEFMINPLDGKAIFLEINPRFWGSLYMSILAGVDFPWLLYRIAMEEEVEDVFTYITGIKCRWLLPGDILHFICSKKKLAMNPPFISKRNTGVYDDIISLQDPLPTLGFILACLRYLPDPGMWRFMFRR